MNEIRQMLNDGYANAAAVLEKSATEPGTLDKIKGMASDAGGAISDMASDAGGAISEATKDVHPYGGYGAAAGAGLGGLYGYLTSDEDSENTTRNTILSALLGGGLGGLGGHMLGRSEDAAGAQADQIDAQGKKIDTLAAQASGQALNPKNKDMVAKGYEADRQAQQEAGDIPLGWRMFGGVADPVQNAYRGASKAVGGAVDAVRGGVGGAVESVGKAISGK